MSNRQRITMKQRKFNDNLYCASDGGNVAEVKKFLDLGADPYPEFDHYNALYAAVERNYLEVAEVLLQSGMGNDPEIVGRVLICAVTPEAIELLAQYSPDCTAANAAGFAASDLIVINKEYDLLASYDRSDLPRAPIKKVVLKAIAKRYDLDQWGKLMKVKVPERYYQRLADFDTRYPWLTYGPNRKKSMIFNKIIREVLAECAS